MNSDDSGTAGNRGQSLKIAILSDLHLNIRRGELVNGGMQDADADRFLADAFQSALQAARIADLVVLAGDVTEGVAGIAWAAESFPGLPVIYVAGNHEFYEHEHRGLLEDLNGAAARTANVRFLENQVAEIAIHNRHLRVLGTTLWTDYELDGTERREQSMREAGRQMADHQWIRHAGSPFLPEHALELHHQSRTWLATELVKHYGGTTVVVTHHPPSAMSIAPAFDGSPLNPAFASDLSGLLLEHAPPLWIHGHTHHNVDYRVGTTRVVSHQWGYPDEPLPLEARLVEI